MFDIFDLCRRMQHHCTLCLQASTTRVFSTVDNLQDAAQVWVELKTDQIFRSFRCQSPYPNNAIVFDVLDIKHLCQVLRNAEKLRGEQYGREMRLSKQINGSGAPGVPLLTFTFRSPKGVKQERNDLPIQLRSHAEMEAMEVPSIDEEESVHVVVPHMSELFHFVETLRSVGGCDHIFFHSRVHSTPSSSRTDRNPHGFSSVEEEGEVEREMTEEKEDEVGSARPLFASLEIEAINPYAKLRLKYGKVQRIPPPPCVDDDADHEEEEEWDGQKHVRTSEEDEMRTPQRGKKRGRSGIPGEESTPVKRKLKSKTKVFLNARNEASVTIPVKKFIPFISAIRSLDLSALSIHLVHERALVFCFGHAHCASVAAYIPAVVPELLG